MYKLLIVDDDDMIRYGIQNSMPWSELEIEDVKTAGTGEEAEAIFSKMQPDIVLTDICMPEMDGLELLQRLKALKNDVRVIILSGFDDFSYAQLALKHGAFDYILKTADIHELSKVFQRAVEDLKQEGEKKDMYLKLRQQLNMSLPLLKYRYLNELVYGSRDFNRLKKQLEFANTVIRDEHFFVAVAEIDDLALLSEDMSEEERLLLKFSVLNIIEELVEDHGICFEGKYEEFICISYLKSGLNEQENAVLLLNTFETINENLQLIFKISLSIGISRYGSGIADVSRCYGEAKKVLEQKLFSGKGSVLLLEDVEDFTEISFQMGIETERKMVSALRTGDKKELLQAAADVFDQMAGLQRLKINEIRKVCIEISGLISRVLYEFDSDLSEIFGREYIYFEEIRKYESFDSIRLYMESILEKTVDFILKTKIIKAKKVVDIAREYIEKHFSEELTLNQIADVVHMSPNYFSSLFSSEAGQSFLEYVTALRIEKAKILLGEKDSKAFEVGCRVGYDNPHYFSRIFKKHIGMSPLEYKESLKQ